MRLIGHSHRYAVEQTALSLFGAVDADWESELRGSMAIARIGSFVAEREIAQPRDESAERFALKIAFYDAAQQVIGSPHPWGAVSGVKPTQLVLKGANLERDYFVSAERAALCRSTAAYARSAVAALEPRNVMLYVGIPFCPTRCAYCSFVSTSVERSLALIEPYLDALTHEIAATSALVRERGERVRAVYIGGGTPTTLSAGQLERLIAELRARFELPDALEFTVEAGRPDTITAEKVAALKSSGVTRVSVNPQTMSDAVLELIGRRHTAADTLRAFELVRSAHFKCVNMDFIAGLPGETEECFQYGIDVALALEPQNLTIHTLTRKRGSNLNAQHSKSRSIIESARSARAEGAAVGGMLSYAYERMRSRGYEPYYLYRQKYSVGGYENTGWSVRGSECLYNACMMEELCSVYALGAGGATKHVTRGSERRVTRSFNKKFPAEYIKDYA